MIKVIRDQIRFEDQYCIQNLDLLLWTTYFLNLLNPLVNLVFNFKHS